MPVYRVMRDYLGVIDGTRYGLEAGALTELDRGAAALINVDRPDTLLRIDEPDAARSLDGPPMTRMVIRAPKRSGSGGLNLAKEPRP